MLVWLLVLTIVLVVIFIGCGIAAWYMFGRPSQISLRRELRGEIPASVYPIDLKRIPPPAPPQRGIPKQIFRTWEDESWKTTYRKAYDHTAKIVPDWPQRVFTSKDRRKFVHEVYAKYPDIVDAYDLCNYGVMEADFWRYLVIYHHGGLYLDMKSSVVKPIDMDLDVDKAYVSTWDSVHHKYLFGNMGEYAQWHILAPPKSEFLWKVIWQVTRNILQIRDEKDQSHFLELGMSKDTKYKILGTTGPFVYTYVGLKYPYMVNVVPALSGDMLLYQYDQDGYKRARKTHYSKQTKPLVNSQVAQEQLGRPLKLGQVPKVLHMTYINKESVPQFVWDNLKKYVHGYEVRFYSDEDCDFYLWKHYGPQVLECWYNQAKGAHKADLFRYAVLAREGGVYLDIKTDLRCPLWKLFDHTIPFTSVETTLENRKNIFNGIMGVSKSHPIMYMAIRFACRPIQYYHKNLDYIHRLLGMELDGTKLQIGQNNGRRGSFVLHQEVFQKGNDRYGYDNSIVNDRGDLLAKTRYHSFGSWEKNQSPLIHIQDIKTTKTLQHKIPNTIFQNHKRRMVPVGLANSIRKIQTHGENYNYVFYDDETSRQYIKTNYPDALEAFDTLIPGAYKSDLFRIVRLYVEGGVYFDAPFWPRDSSLLLDKLLKPTDTFVSANDRGYGLFNAFMASIPQHPILKAAINYIIGMVKHRRYGTDMYHITGPRIYISIFQQLKLEKCCTGKYPNGIRFVGNHTNDTIPDHHNTVLYYTRYPTYDKDRILFWGDSPHYSALWNSRQVFRTIPKST